MLKLKFIKRTVGLIKSNNIQLQETIERKKTEIDLEKYRPRKLSKSKLNSFLILCSLPKKEFTCHDYFNSIAVSATGAVW